MCFVKQKDQKHVLPNLDQNINNTMCFLINAKILLRKISIDKQNKTK